MAEAEKLCWSWVRLDGLRPSKSLMVMSWFLLLVKWLCYGLMLPYLAWFGNAFTCPSYLFLLNRT
nr:MAG TPA: hypothetical protein [Caudoviricetes sp.]